MIDPNEVRHYLDEHDCIWRGDDGQIHIDAPKMMKVLHFPNTAEGRRRFDQAMIEWAKSEGIDLSIVEDLE